MENNSKKILRIAAGVAVVALIAILLYGGRFLKTKTPTAQVAPKVQGGERTVLYWYDAMDPQHTYNKPGKAPDGMDLVPKYADAEAPASGASQPASADAKPAERKILYWYDPMHPAYRADKAGIAPDCGMQLVPKYAEEESMSNMPAGTVKIVADKQQMMGVRTALVERKALVREILTTAQIVPDERRIAHVHVKVSGNIEKIYVDFIGQLVKKGQPLFTLYSPDLVSTQEEYLIAKRGAKTLGAAPYKEVSEGAQSLLRSARERLHLWDISEDQIRKLDETGEVSHTMTFYSPISGFVTDRKAFAQTSVTPDTELYTISDLSAVWATADVYELLIGWHSMKNTKLDAIPDLSDTQVIVYAKWDRSPDIMEDQVTYPDHLGAAGLAEGEGHPRILGLRLLLHLHHLRRRHGHLLGALADA
jgi:Cu(I)/Ag(I) efflux system membrane fusion protein